MYVFYMYNRRRLCTLLNTPLATRYCYWHLGRSFSVRVYIHTSVTTHAVCQSHGDHVSSTAQPDCINKTTTQGRRVGWQTAHRSTRGLGAWGRPTTTYIGTGGRWQHSLSRRQNALHTRPLCINSRTTTSVGVTNSIPCAILCLSHSTSRNIRINLHRQSWTAWFKLEMAFF